MLEFDDIMDEIAYYSSPDWRAIGYLEEQLEKLFLNYDWKRFVWYICSLSKWFNYSAML